MDCFWLHSGQLQQLFMRCIDGLLLAVFRAAAAVIHLGRHHHHHIIIVRDDMTTDDVCQDE